MCQSWRVDLVILEVLSYFFLKVWARVNILQNVLTQAEFLVGPEPHLRMVNPYHFWYHFLP